MGVRDENKGNDKEEQGGTCHPTFQKRCMQGLCNLSTGVAHKRFKQGRKERLRSPSAS